LADPIGNRAEPEFMTLGLTAEAAARGEEV
jgi:hypothetical protein